MIICVLSFVFTFPGCDFKVVYVISLLSFITSLSFKIVLFFFTPRPTRKLLKSVAHGGFFNFWGWESGENK